MEQPEYSPLLKSYRSIATIKDSWHAQIGNVKTQVNPIGQIDQMGQVGPKAQAMLYLWVKDLPSGVNLCPDTVIIHNKSLMLKADKGGGKRIEKSHGLSLCNSNNKKHSLPLCTW